MPQRNLGILTELGRRMAAPGKSAVVMGDFNAELPELPADLLQRAGLRAVPFKGSDLTCFAAAGGSAIDRVLASRELEPWLSQAEVRSSATI